MDRKRNFSFYSLRILSICLIAFLAFACATKRYWGPSMGRSADSQSTPAAALEKALKTASFEQYRGKKIWVEVYSLTDRIGDKSAEEEFLLSWMNEKLVSQGAAVASSKDQSEILIEVKARVFGVSQTRRDFIPLFYSESTKGIVDLHLTSYDQRSGKIVQVEDLKGESSYREDYILYMFGPIKSIQ
jgi:hypothetical protein